MNSNGATAISNTATSCALRRNPIALPVILLFLLWIVVGCEKPVGGRESNAEPSAVPVEVGLVEKADVPVVVRSIGWVESMASVTVRPQVDGQISSVHFQEGQFVAADDVLFELDSRLYDAALRLAEANLARDRAMADDSALYAQRMRGLYSGGDSAPRELEAAEADAAAKKAQVQADEAAVSASKLRLGFCTIRSPIAGRTGPYLVTPGNIVQENETPLISIQQIDPIYVAFSVPEQYLPQVRVRFAAGELSVEARPVQQADNPTTGLVTFVDSQVDRNTGMVRLKATVANSSRELWPGQYMRVASEMDLIRDAIVVPTVAVQTGQQGAFVYVVTTGEVVELRPVITGLMQDKRTVITSGLSAGEIVVTDGHLRLRPGLKIERRNALPTMNSGTTP